MGPRDEREDDKRWGGAGERRDEVERAGVRSEV